MYHQRFHTIPAIESFFKPTSSRFKISIPQPNLSLTRYINACKHSAVTTLQVQNLITDTLNHDQGTNSLLICLRIKYPRLPLKLQKSHWRQLNSIQQLQLQMITEITLLTRPISCSSGAQVTLWEAPLLINCQRNEAIFKHKRLQLCPPLMLGGPIGHSWEPTFDSLAYRFVLGFLNTSTPMIFNMFEGRKWKEEKAYNYNSFILQMLNKYYVSGSVLNTDGKGSSNNKRK